MPADGSPRDRSPARSTDDSGSDQVPLTDLDLIQRYSLAVRSATAPRADVIEALRADLAWLEETTPVRPAKRAPVAKAPAAGRPATAPATSRPGKAESPEAAGGATKRAPRSAARKAARADS